MKAHLIALMMLASVPAHAVGVIFVCGTTEIASERVKADGGAPLITLTPEQFQFMRAVAVQMKDTPDSLPPCDHAMMSISPDGSATVVFVDGDAACEPVKITKHGVDFLMQVGSGDVVHSGSGT